MAHVDRLWAHCTALILPARVFLGVCDPEQRVWLRCHSARVFSQDVVSARGGAALSSRGDGRDSETWLGQELEDTSELKFVGNVKGGKSRADGRSIQGKVGWGAI